MPMSSPLLTIAIPTFNRNEALAQLLTKILPQIGEGVRLVIADNCSEVPVATVVDPLRARFPDADVRLLRNRVNVGANANILRCFELCESDWIWVVGDDDEVEPEAVATILQRIAEHPDCLLINFPIDTLRPASKRTTGLREFVDAIDPSADVPWITSTVYKVPELLPNLRIGYQFAFSMLPHVAMLLVSLKDDHRCLFAADHIASRDRASAGTEQQTPIINMALGFPVLLDLPIDLDVRRKIVRKLLVTSDSPGLPLRQLAYQLLLLSLKTGNRREALYFFDQACLRRFYFDKTFVERIEIFAYRGLLILPPRLIGNAYKAVKRRELGAQISQDRIARL